MKFKDLKQSDEFFYEGTLYRKYIDENGVESCYKIAGFMRNDKSKEIEETTEVKKNEFIKNFGEI